MLNYLGPQGCKLVWMCGIAGATNKDGVHLYVCLGVCGKVMSNGYI